MHLITKETSEIEERPVAVRLPKWVWEVLQSRANFCHGGDFNEAFAEIMGMGLLYLGEQVLISETDPPQDPENWH